MTVKQYSIATGIPEHKVRRMLAAGKIDGHLLPGGKGEDGKMRGPSWEVTQPVDQTPLEGGSGGERFRRGSAPYSGTTGTGRFPPPWEQREGPLA